MASKPITRLKTKQAPKEEVENVVHEEVSYITKELNEFPNSFRQNPPPHVWDGNSVKRLFEWLAEVFIKRWPTENELQVPDISWFSVGEGISRLRKMQC